MRLRSAGEAHEQFIKQSILSRGEGCLPASQADPQGVGGGGGLKRFLGRRIGRDARNETLEDVVEHPEVAVLIRHTDQREHRSPSRGQDQIDRAFLGDSEPGANPASSFAPMRDHAATEALALSADGPVSWTAHADLAEAAAIALAHEGRLDGITPPLTASQALDFTAVAQLSSPVTGSRITRTTTSDTTFARRCGHAGPPEAQVDMTLSIFAASRGGEFAAVDPTLEQLLGRTPPGHRATSSPPTNRPGAATRTTGQGAAPTTTVVTWRGDGLAAGVGLVLG